MAQGDRAFTDPEDQTQEMIQSIESTSTFTKENTEEKKGAERRTSRRKNSQIPFRLRLRTDASFREQPLQTINLSPNGFLFEYHEPFFIGNEFVVELFLGEEWGHIECHARVVHIIEIEKRRRYYIGALFFDLSQSLEDQLVSFIQRYDVEDLLRLVVAANASDLHLVVGLAPALRVGSSLQFVAAPPLRHEEIQHFLDGVLKPEDRIALNQEKEIFLVKDFFQIGRFRMCIHVQQGTLTAAFRKLPDLKSWEEIGLPLEKQDFILKKSGLVLVSLPEESSRISVLAALIDRINSTDQRVIACVEKMPSILHTPKKSLIRHIHVGREAKSYLHALEMAIRCGADVVSIGEIENRAVLDRAIEMATQGCLVLAPLGYGDPQDTQERALQIFPKSARDFAAYRLAACLNGIVAQSEKNDHSSFEIFPIRSEM